MKSKHIKKFIKDNKAGFRTGTVDVEKFLTSSAFNDLVKMTAMMGGDSEENIRLQHSAGLRSGRLYFDKNGDMRLNPDIKQQDFGSDV